MENTHYKTGQLLVRLGNMVTWFRNQRLQNKELTSGQAGIIGYLQKYAENGITTVELARELNHSKAAVSELLKTMEKKSLIRRFEDPEDARKKWIFLTELGKDREKDLQNVIAENEQIILSGMTEQEKKELSRLLEIALENMNRARREEASEERL